MKKSLLYLLLVLIIVSAKVCAQARLKKTNYSVLVFNEEFDYADVAAMNAAAVWKPETGVPTPGESPYEFVESNISFPVIAGTTNHVLRLKVAKQPTDRPTPAGLSYSAAGVVLTLDIDPQDGPCDWGPTNPTDPNVTWKHGLQFGMIEIRCKLPSTWGAWPAVWLVNPDTELDIIDNNTQSPHRQWNNGMIDWRKYNTSKKAGVILPVEEYTCGGQILKGTSNRNRDLARDFNTYTLVWTPNKITLFLNGREQYTVPNSVVANNFIHAESHTQANCSPAGSPNHRNGYGCTATIRLGNSLTGNLNPARAYPLPPSFTEEAYFDVDYVRVYKAKPGADVDDYLR